MRSGQREKEDRAGTSGWADARRTPGGERRAADDAMLAHVLLGLGVATSAGPAFP
jgi:hypothetical protein